MVLSSKSIGQNSGIDTLRTEGSMKALFPRANDVSAIMINTSGGLTGGDQFQINATAGQDSQMTLTTQAAERAYRSALGVAQMHGALTVEANARLNWLPQELILFDGCALNRSLTADLSGTAELLLVEPVVFGRFAMNEVVQSGSFQDRIEISRDGRPIYFDAMALQGDMAQHLKGRARAAGMGAMASVVLASPKAQSQLSAVRSLLPDTGGASLLAEDLLVLRLVAQDSFTLRTSLLPILDRLTGDALPTSWRL